MQRFHPNIAPVAPSAVGVMLLGDDGTKVVAVPAELVRSLPASAEVAEYINIRNKGALSDGSDARAAIQAAMDDASALANADPARPFKVAVYFPHGRFAIDSSILWPASGVMVCGPGTIERRNATTATSHFALFVASGDADVEIRDITAWGVGPDRALAASINGPSTLGARDSLIDATGCTGFLTIDKVGAFRFRNAILIGNAATSAGKVRILDCDIDSMSSKNDTQYEAGTFSPYDFATPGLGDPGAGIRILGERGGVEQKAGANKSLIRGNTITIYGLDICIDLASQSHAMCEVIVEANHTFGGNSGVQNYSSNGAIPDDGTWTTDSRGPQIHDNHIHYAWQQGIYVRQVAGVKLQNNYIIRCAMVGTEVGSSAGGIVCRGATPAAYDVSPISHDGWVDVIDNHIIDPGALNGALNAGIRLDPWQIRCHGNILTRSVDRFGSARWNASSIGIAAIEIGITTTPSGTATTNATDTITMTSLNGIAPRNTYTISGETGQFTVLEVNRTALTAKLNRVCSTSVSGRTVTSVASTLRCNWRRASIKHNYVAGFGDGLNASYQNWVLRERGSCEISWNTFEDCTRPVFLDPKMAGPIFERNTLRVANGGAQCLFLKNAPYTEVVNCEFDGGTNSIDFRSGCLASDYWQVGGRMGQTVILRGNKFRNFTSASIVINETATGDINLVSRCLEASGNYENDRINQPNSTLATDGAPSATGSNGGYRCYARGEYMVRRNQAASTAPGHYCTTDGSFGATIPGAATTTASSAVIAFSSLSGIVPGVCIAIAGVTGTKRVLTIDTVALTAVVDVVCDAAVSGVTPTHVSPTHKAEPALAA